MINLTMIPEEARIQLYIKKKIFIPLGKVYSSTTSLSASELSKLIETLTIKCDSALLDKIGEFSLSEKQIENCTGLSWENILEIKDLMTSLRNSQSRSVIQALIVFLFKLRTGNSNKLLASKGFPNRGDMILNVPIGLI